MTLCRLNPSTIYDATPKPVNASKCNLSLSLFECTPTFILYHQHSARWSRLFNYFLLCRILGGGGSENFFGGVDILFGGEGL